MDRDPGFLWQRAANLLYKNSFPLYQVGYFAYKMVHERHMIKLLKQRIKPGMTALDIGGNIGFYTTLLATLVGPTGRVHTFEPDDTNYKNLNKVTRRCGNVDINRCAVGTTSGSILLYRSGTLNVDHRTYPTDDKRATVEVPCVAIDDYFSHNELVDFVKIDIQGYEYFALLGMRRTIKRTPKMVMLAEFWPYGLTQAGVKPNEYMTLIQQLGFAIEVLGQTREDSEYDEKARDKSFYMNLLATKNI